MNSHKMKLVIVTAGKAGFTLGRFHAENRAAVLFIYRRRVLCCGALRSHANRGGSDRAKSEN